MTDQRTAAEAVHPHIRWWPGSIEVKCGAAYVRRWEAEQPSLARFAGHHLHGLKFGVICESALSDAVLYADTDTLWSAPPERLLAGAPPGGTPWLRLSSDLSRSYHADLLRALGREVADRRCAGVIAARGNLLSLPLTAECLKTAIRLPSHFAWTEQTIFALISEDLGVPPWPMSAVRFSYADYWCPLPFMKPRQVVRHYPGHPMRDLFWIHGRAVARRSEALHGPAASRGCTTFPAETAPTCMRSPSSGGECS